MNNKLVKKSQHRALGVYCDGEVVFLFYHLERDEGSFFRIESSRDGVNFSLFHPICEIVDEQGERVDSRKISDLALAKTHQGYFLSYKFGQRLPKQMFGATSENLAGFKTVGKVAKGQERASVVSDFQYGGKYVMYTGENSINVAYSYDFVNWQIEKTPVLTPRSDFFGTSPLLVSNTYLIDEGILVFYFDQKRVRGSLHYFLHAALFDKNDPQKLIKSIEDPLWEPHPTWHKMNLQPVGVALHHGELLTYWQGKEGIIVLVHPFALDKALDKQTLPHVILKKLKHNPIIRPLIENFWESKATFNPAAFYDREKVHIIYRAIGNDDISTLGYATSLDGVHIDWRSPQPVYTPTQPFEGTGIKMGIRESSFSPFASGGGGYGGIEDPRITKIDETIYMTYVAYDGINPPRVALTSISEGDFHSQNWNWKDAVLISPPGLVDKNACILPEKIGGKYVIFHRIFPDILVDFVDNLEFDGTKFLKGEYKIEPREDYWDSRKIGIGATPIKTDDGWLLIYHAVGDKDPGRYKIGAMILDHNNPTKVLYRTKMPVIEPDEHYENEGYKSGVVYPCGAVKLKDDLIVYYGGADTVVCAATENFDYFVKKLKEHKEEDILGGFRAN